MDSHPELSEEARVVADGASVEEASLTRGFALLFARVEAMRREAMLMVLSLGNSPEVGVQWRTRLATLDEVIGLPEEFQRERAAAQDALKQDAAYAGILHAA